MSDEPKPIKTMTYTIKADEPGGCSITSET